MRLILVVMLVACGGTRAQVEAEKEGFLCKERAVSYVASKHISCDELGAIATRGRRD